MDLNEYKKDLSSMLSALQQKEDSLKSLMQSKLSEVSDPDKRKAIDDLVNDVTSSNGDVDIQEILKRANKIDEDAS